jgi:hypothetical protein
LRRKKGELDVGSSWPFGGKLASEQSFIPAKYNVIGFPTVLALSICAKIPLQVSAAIVTDEEAPVQTVALADNGQNCHCRVTFPTANTPFTQPASVKYRFVMETLQPTSAFVLLAASSATMR